MSLIFTEPHRTSRSIGTTISPPPWNLPEHRGPSRPPSARRRGNPPSIADHRANPGPHPRFFLPFRLTETGRVPTSHSGIGQTRIFRGQTEPCGSSQRRKILGWPESPMPGGAGREEKCASSQTMQAARPIRCRRSPGHSPHETRRYGSRTEDTSELQRRSDVLYIAPEAGAPKARKRTGPCVGGCPSSRTRPAFGRFLWRHRSRSGGRTHWCRRSRVAEPGVMHQWMRVFNSVSSQWLG